MIQSSLWNMPWENKYWQLEVFESGCLDEVAICQVHDTVLIEFLSLDKYLN